MFPDLLPCAGMQLPGAVLGLSREQTLPHSFNKEHFLRAYGLGALRSASLRRRPAPNPQGVCSLQRWGGEQLFTHRPPNLEEPAVSAGSSDRRPTKTGQRWREIRETSLRHANRALELPQKMLKAKAMSSIGCITMARHYLKTH